MCVFFQIFDSWNAVFIQEELAQVGVLRNVVNLCDLVIREVNPLESSWWVKVQHLGQFIAASVKLQKVFEVGQRRQRGQTVTR